MKCETATVPPNGKEWIYELKLDGIRALAIKEEREVRLYSRTKKDLAPRFPAVIQALQNLPQRRLVLDGEIVALDAEGRPSFQELQGANCVGRTAAPVLYYVFDLLQSGDRDLTNRPLHRRKKALADLSRTFREPLRFAATLDGSGKDVIEAVSKLGLEGIIAKQQDSIYQPGVRSRAWVKYKINQEQEFVIGGYTAPSGSRAFFGAILVGYYERAQLRFASKVGSGFDFNRLSCLYREFKRLGRDSCPFVNLPEPPGGRWAPGLTATEMRKCSWVEPELVCQVRFAEWTRDAHLRQPVFLGLREDKSPRDVKRELVQRL